MNEFVEFIMDLGVQSVNNSRAFFKEMATTSTAIHKSDLPKTILKIDFFITNFLKFT